MFGTSTDAREPSGDDARTEREGVVLRGTPPGRRSLSSLVVGDRRRSRACRDERNGATSTIGTPM
ncbi:hypothetical protein BRC68_11255 [Halobacteriales archaeon QH_6_64_20]|nr:MAG: hypothetical protein BRC68_11255 [Halobacteriales archaeon QH_6_64_20]